MHASWFQKPIYRIAVIIAFISLLACGVLALITPLYLYCMILLVLFWLIFFISASFTIHSGVYIKTICNGPVEGRKIAITFDDGPDKNTPLILDILEKNGVKASFFLIGEKVERNTSVVLKMINAKNTVGNHSCDHKSSFPMMGVKKIKENIASAQELIKQATGTYPVYFRPPFGVTNPLIARALKSFNLKVIGWSVRSLDTVNTDPEQVFARIIKRLEPGSIILLHDTSSSVIPVLNELLLYCSRQNITPVSLDELLK
jgi:peptidoglycan/xylan/chitin deacetylase (PgdA/CDA1 family)